MNKKMKKYVQKNLKKVVAPMALTAGLLVASPAMAYEVKSGDTMGEIATANSLSLNQLAAMNPQVSNVDLIYVGQTINTSQNNTQPVSKPVQAVTSTVGNVSASDVDLMARLVRAEALGEPYAGKVAVAYVVLNRVDSSQFPNTIKGVIYQKGQFSPVSNGAINTPADADSIRAVKEAIASDRSRGAGSLFFYNPKTASSRWLDSKQTTVIIGNHVFKK
ncbi:cell wall hydrolase [Cytobacillus firmus]|nr:cell wall hydrolase [Cytobacillus firmus]